MSMQIHGPSEILTAADIGAYLNSPGFAILRLGSFQAYLDQAEQCDWIIAAAVEAKQLLAPPACPSVAEHSGRPCTETGEHVKHRNGMIVWGPGITEPEDDAPVVVTEAEDARRATGNEDHCSAVDADTKYICTSQAGHGGLEHIAWRLTSGEYHRWPAAPVASGAPLAVTEDERCECAHRDGQHPVLGGKSKCLILGCGCLRFRSAAAKAQPEPPAVVAGTVEAEQRSVTA